MNSVVPYFKFCFTLNSSCILRRLRCQIFTGISKDSITLTFGFKQYVYMKSPLLTWIFTIYHCVVCDLPALLELLVSCLKYGWNTSPRYSYQLCHSWNANYIKALGSAQPLNRNEYLGSKGGQCLELTTLTPSCTDCIEILVASTSWTPTRLFRREMG